MLKYIRIIYFASWVIILNGATTKFDPKSVNLELETSLQFDPTQGNHSIKEIKNFINRLQNLLIPIKELLYPNKNKMSDVIENVAIKVNEYDDKEFGKLSRIFVKEIDDHLSNNKHLSVLLGDKYRNVMKYIQNNPTVIRIQTRKSANSKHFKTIKNLISKLDKYYDSIDVMKLKAIADQLEQAPKRNEDLRKLVKEALNVLVFDKYKKLNSTSKSQLFAELLTMQTQLKMKLNNGNQKTILNEEDSKSDIKGKLSGEDESTTLNINHEGDIILSKNIEIFIENDDLKSDET